VLRDGDHVVAEAHVEGLVELAELAGEAREAATVEARDDVDAR